MACEHLITLVPDRKEHHRGGCDAEIIVTADQLLLITRERGVVILQIRSSDPTNRLTRRSVRVLTDEIRKLSTKGLPFVITGNNRFFSAGADLGEIATLRGPDAYEFAKMGQELMQAVADFPAPVHAAISGYCMGGGLDLALACHYRIAAPNAVFGHRGAALGLITGWGGTQRLPRLVGKARALEMFVVAENIRPDHALSIGLIDAIADDPVSAALDCCVSSRDQRGRRLIARFRPAGIP